MSSTENSSQWKLVLDRIYDRLQERYVTQAFGESEYFRTANSAYFSPFAFPDWNALAIEYAEDESEAEKGRFEDGDLFYLDEMTEDQIFEAMIAEIEDA